MNIFERIQHQRGLENYCTDILVGILKKDSDLLQSFCVEVLKISDIPNNDSLKISSQAHYKGINSDEKKSYVDIQISGTNFLCFLEMKVESSVNQGQLKKYNDVLHSDKKLENIQNKYLRFCTKYVADVQENETLLNFQKFRWYEIHDFFKVFCKDNTLVNEFSEFLSLNNMDNKILSYDKKLYETIVEFNSILINVKKAKYEIQDLELKFPQPNLELRFNRYGFTFRPFKEENTAIFIGFLFEKGDIYKQVQLWHNDKVNSELYKYTFEKENDNEIWNNGLSCHEILKPEGEQASDIEGWFIDKLKSIKK